MKAGSDNLKDVLTGSCTFRFFVDVFYGGERTMQDVPVLAPDLRWDSEADLKASASVVVVYTPKLAESLSPSEFTDKLAPFGNEVSLSVVVSAGRFRERIQLGIYRIQAVPSAYDEHMQFLGRPIVTGSRVELTLVDRSSRLKRRGFLAPEQPPAGSTGWGELARITGMQMVRNVPDKGWFRSDPYEASQGGRLKAVQQICAELGGVPVFNPYGQLTVLPDANGDIATELVLGERGTILDVDYSMDSESVYNEVVGNFEDPDRNPLNVVAQITTGPLAVSGEYDHNTLYMGGLTFTNKEAAQQAVNTRLFNLRSQNSYRVPVTCLYNPLIDDGDVVSVERPTKTLVGRAVSHSTGGDGQMNLVLEIPRPL